MTVKGSDVLDRASARAYLEAIAAPPPRPRRRAAVAWLAFGLVGLTMGVVWAAGLATSTTTGDTTANTAPPVLGAPSAAVASRFTGAVTTVDPLDIGFSGSWGLIAADTKMYEIDLTGPEFATGTYFATVLVTDPMPTNFEQLQLELLIEDTDCASVVDWSAPLASSVMTIDSQDARALFTNLPGNDTYCIGVAATAKADDTAGTFIRRPTGSTAVTFPVFLAGVNQSA